MTEKVIGQLAAEGDYEGLNEDDLRAHSAGVLVKILGQQCSRLYWNMALEKNLFDPSHGGTPVDLSLSKEKICDTAMLQQPLTNDTSVMTPAINHPIHPRKMNWTALCHWP